MNVIETRLAGHQATMKHITRLINRHLGGMQLARVELSFSTQSAERLVPEAAKKSIAVLLREHGMGMALVSVRPHDGPIDDASGDHVVRLFPSHRGDVPVLPRSGLSDTQARSELARLCAMLDSMDSEAGEQLERMETWLRLQLTNTEMQTLGRHVRQYDLDEALALLRQAPGLARWRAGADGLTTGSHPGSRL